MKLQIIVECKIFGRNTPKLGQSIKHMPVFTSRLFGSSIHSATVASKREFFQHILGLQPRDKAAMLVVKTKEIFLLNLHQNRVHFPAERNAFVLDHQHGRRDVTCKPAIE